MRILLLIALWFPLLANAEVYKYVNDEGVTVYVTDVSEVPEQYRNQVQDPAALPKITKSDYSAYDNIVIQKKPSAKKVELYVTSWCAYCEQAEAFLRANKIRFRKYDIERSAIGRQKHLKAGGGGVPVIKIGSEYIRGFDEMRLKQALGIS